MSRPLSLLPLLASPLALALVLSAAACSRGPSGDAGSATQAAPAPAVPPPLDQPREDVPPATAPAASDAGNARYDGYAGLRLGMTAAEVRQAWAGKLDGTPPADTPGNEACYYLSPAGNPSQAYFALMIERDKFVRYDVGNDKDVAPGGGKVGMSTAEIEALYPDRVETGPHKYVEGGKYLRIKADDGSSGVLVFETDADGKVTEWRVGQPPAVDYVEGCS